MNMYIHGIADYHLEFGDTFLYPKLKEGEGIKQFDFVMANPPWNQDGYDEKSEKGEFGNKDSVTALYRKLRQTGLGFNTWLLQPKMTPERSES